MNTVYNSPENLGLEVVAEHEFCDDYGFDLRVIWRHLETGVLYTAHDSGCSCPPPFEDYRKLEDLERVDFDELLEEALDAQRSNHRHYGAEAWIAELRQLRATEAVRAKARELAGKP
jgi:hypothetical protein